MLLVYQQLDLLVHLSLLTSTGITGSIGTVSPNVKEELEQNAVTGVSATGSINTVTQHTTAGLTSVGLSGVIQKPSVTIIQFDYVAVAHLYSQRRTVTLPKRAA